MFLQTIAKTMPALAVLAMLATGACNTVEGMGKDLKSGGAAIENAASKAKK